MRPSLFVRMTAPVVIVSGVLLFVSVLTAAYVLRLQQEATDVILLHAASIRAAEELEIGMREIRTRINQFLLTGDIEHLSAVPELRNSSDRWLDEASRLAVSTHERKLMVSVRRGYDNFFKQFDELADSPTDADRSQFRNLVDEVLTREILQPAHAYLDLNEQMMQSSSARARATTNRLVFGVLLLGTCGPLAGLIAGFAIARRISRSLVQMTVPVRDAAGKLNEVVGPITLSANSDIDELGGLLRQISDEVIMVVNQLQQSQREVLRAEQLAAVGQLAAGVAHEVRNPLQSIQLLVQSAIDDNGSGVLEGHDLMVLQDAVSRVKRSVQAFLDFARPPSLEKRWLNLSEIVGQTLELVNIRARREGVDLESRLPAEAIQLYADADQMRQLVLNLLLNALDAVPVSGKVWVELHSEQKPLAPDEKSGNLVVLEVSDNGAGLSEKLGERIFEPFVTSKETGLGLGLAICKRIVESHGGTIQATDRPSGGASFRVYFPQKPAVENTTPTVFHRTEV